MANSQPQSARFMPTAALAALLSACTTSGIDLYPQEPPATAQVVSVATTEVRVNRYTSVLSEPTVSEVLPLQSVIHISYPRDVRSVGQALDYTLLRSGYRLGTASSAEQSLFRDLALPESQRVLGPYTVERVLQTLIGSEWQLTVNHPARVVSFVALAPGQGAPSPLAPVPSHNVVDAAGVVIAPVELRR